LQVSRTRRIYLDQSPQSGHLHIDTSIESASLATSRQGQKPLARQGLTGMRNQRIKHRKFSGGQGNRCSVALEKPGGRQQAEASKVYGRTLIGRCSRRCGLTATHDRADPRGELAWIAGLGQIVVCTDLETQYPVDVIALRGQHDDGHQVSGRPQIATDVEAAAVGQHEIKHHQVDRELLESSRELLTIPGNRDLKSLTSQKRLKQTAEA
jgi:hypothetical protein